MPKRKKNKAPEPQQPSVTCPLCNVSRRVEETPLRNYFHQVYGGADRKDYAYGFNAWLLQIARGSPVSGWQIKASTRGHWCCNACLRAGKALLPDWTQQNYRHGGPLICYLPVKMDCQQCGVVFDFSAEEQKFWYEDLHFFVDSHPKHCPDCRKQIRQKHAADRRYGELVHLEKPSPEELEELYTICVETGRAEKAKEIAGRIAKLDRRPEY